MKTTMNRMTHDMIILALMALLSLTAVKKVHADDIHKGMRGPTMFQLHSQGTYARNEKGLQTLGTNAILKYWTGDELGIWGYANIPYRHKSMGDATSSGFGDINVAIGPRGRWGDLHWKGYGGLALPTGNPDDRPPGGNGRWDSTLGAIVTYLAPSGNWELSGDVKRTWTGDGEQGNPPDELYASLLGGLQPIDRLWAATGPTMMRKDNGDYNVEWMLAIRYTPSKTWAFQVVGKTSIAGEEIPSGTSAQGQVRFNF
ncbi:MAG: hypothetical protein ABIC95_01570 [archaeon]